MSLWFKNIKSSIKILAFLSARIHLIELTQAAILKVAFFYPGDTEDMETNLVAKTIIKTLIDNHIEIKFQKSWLEEYHHGISKNNVFEKVLFHW